MSTQALQQAKEAVERAVKLKVWDNIPHALHVELDVIFNALAALATVSSEAPYAEPATVRELIARLRQGDADAQIAADLLETRATVSSEAQPAALTDEQKTELLDWVSACQSAYHIESTPGHRFGGLGGQLQENREALVEYVESILVAASPAPDVRPSVPVSDEPVCQTCNGHGLVGGMMSWGDGQVDSIADPCPDCQPAAPVQHEPVAAQPQDEDLLPHLRQFMHNNGSGFVAGYDIPGVDRLVSFLRAKATPNFETADDLIAWLDSLYETEGSAITNRKWEVAQIAIAAIAARPVQPVEYQRRMRPTWLADGEGWTEWERCSEGSYNDALRLKIYNDWQYEARALYVAAQPQEALGTSDGCKRHCLSECMWLGSGPCPHKKPQEAPQNDYTKLRYAVKAAIDRGEEIGDESWYSAEELPVLTQGVIKKGDAEFIAAMSPIVALGLINAAQAAPAEPDDDALPAFIAHAKRLYTGNPKGHPDWAAFEAGFNAHRLSQGKSGYQTRWRSNCTGEDHAWQEWRSCSEASARDYERNPVQGDYEFQVRSAAAPSAPAEKGGT